MRPALLLVVAPLALSVAGCGGPIVTHIQNDDRAFVSSYYRYDAADGEVAVEVYGAPPGADPARFAAEVAAGIEPPFWEPPARFRAVAHGGAPFRMVLLVGAPVNVGGPQACRAPEAVGLFPAAAPLRVQGAMCHGEKALTSAVASLDPPPDGPQDPRFRDLLRQLAFVLMPEERKDNGVFEPVP